MEKEWDSYRLLYRSTIFMGELSSWVAFLMTRSEMCFAEGIYS